MIKKIKGFMRESKQQRVYQLKQSYDTYMQLAFNEEDPWMKKHYCRMADNLYSEMIYLEE